MKLGFDIEPNSTAVSEMRENNTTFKRTIDGIK
jgi:hypothetical protein